MEHEMKSLISILLMVGIVGASINVLAAEPVDSRSKQVVVNPDDIQKDVQRPQRAAADKANAALKNCRKGICLQTKCVPGCDPPDERNTVHGCSSCYSEKCVSWEEVCD
jgi:hypothetical protein